MMFGTETTQQYPISVDSKEESSQILAPNRVSPRSALLEAVYLEALLYPVFACQKFANYVNKWTSEVGKTNFMYLVLKSTSSALYNFCNKAELPQEGILFCTQFPSLGIFINKKVGFRKKLRPPSIQLLKLI